jgi:hydroxyacylglutathione hydrolase
MGSFLVKSVPYLDDNLAYLVLDVKSGKCAVVDPGVAAPIIGAIEDLRRATSVPLSVSHILVTHRHHDHCGGLADLKKAVPSARVFASAEVHGADVVLDEGQEFVIGGGEASGAGGATVRALRAPCHTKGHVLFLVQGAEGSKTALFTGDTST